MMNINELIQAAQETQEQDRKQALEQDTPIAMDAMKKNGLDQQGIPESEYDYVAAYQGGQSFEPVGEDAGIQLDNKYRKPNTLTMNGTDLANGNNIQQGSQDSLGLIAQAQEELMQSFTNTATGANPNDITSLTKAAYGYMADGVKSFEEFQSNFNGVPPEYLVTAWQAASKANERITIQGAIENDAIAEPVDWDYPRFKESYAPDDLMSNENYLNFAKAFYKMRMGKDADELELSNEEIHKFMLWEMSMFNMNIPHQAMITNKAMNGDEDTKRLIYAMMVLDENMDVSAGGVARGVGALALDPFTYLGGFGLGKAVGKAGQIAAKKQLGKWLATSMQAGALATTGAIQGSVYTTLDDLFRQTISAEADQQDSIDLSQAGDAAATGAILGAGFSVGIPAAVKAGKGAYNGAQAIMESEYAKEFAQSLREGANQTFTDTSMYIPQSQRGSVGDQSYSSMNVDDTYLSIMQQALPKKGDADLYEREISRMVKSGTIKPDEYKWSGLATLFDEAKTDGRTLTRKEVLDYVDENSFKVEKEVLTSENGGNRMSYNEAYDAAEDDFDNFSDQGVGDISEYEYEIDALYEDYALQARQGEDFDDEIIAAGEERLTDFLKMAGIKGDLVTPDNLDNLSDAIAEGEYKGAYDAIVKAIEENEAVNKNQMGKGTKWANSLIEAIDDELDYFDSNLIEDFFNKNDPKYLDDNGNFSEGFYYNDSRELAQAYAVSRAIYNRESEFYESVRESYLAADIDELLTEKATSYYEDRLPHVWTQDGDDFNYIIKDYDNTGDYSPLSGYDYDVIDEYGDIIFSTNNWSDARREAFEHWSRDGHAIEYIENRDGIIVGDDADDGEDLWKQYSWFGDDDFNAVETGDYRVLNFEAENHVPETAEYKNLRGADIPKHFGDAPFAHARVSPLEDDDGVDTAMLWEIQSDWVQRPQRLKTSLSNGLESVASRNGKLSGTLKEKDIKPLLLNEQFYVPAKYDDARYTELTNEYDDTFEAIVNQLDFSAGENEIQKSVIRLASLETVLRRPSDAKQAKTTDGYFLLSNELKEAYANRIDASRRFIEDNFDDVPIRDWPDANVENYMKALGRKMDRNELQPDLYTQAKIFLQSEVYTKHDDVADLLKLYTTAYTKKPTIPEPPMKNKYHESVFRQVVKDAFDTGEKAVSWPATPQGVYDVERWGSVKATLDDDNKALYMQGDKNVTTIVERMTKLLPAYAKKFHKSLGGNGEIVKTTIQGKPVYRFDITDEMRDKLNKGVPLFELGTGVAGAGVLAMQKENKGNDDGE